MGRRQFLRPRQPLNNCLVLGKSLGQFRALPHLEVFKIKSGRDRAAHDGKRFPICDVRGEPAACADDRLQDLSSFGIASQQNRRVLPFWIDDVNYERFACVEVPDLVGAQAMEG